MPLDPQQLDLYLGSNGGEAAPADPQNIPLVFGLVPSFAEGAVTLLITAAGDGVRGVAGDGAVTLLFSGAGDGEHQSLATEGDGQVALLITAAGTGQHGRAGYGEAFLTFAGSGVGVHGHGGTGDVTFNITAAGDGYLVPTGIGAVDLLTIVAEGYHRSLGFDILARRASGFRAPWSPSKPVQPILYAPWVRTQRGDRDVRAPWAATTKLDAERRYPWGLAREADRDSRVPWGKFTRKLQTDRRYPWTKSREADRDSRMPWGPFGRALQPEQHYPWTRSREADNDLHAPWGGPLLVTQVETLIPWGKAVPRNWEQYIPWLKYSRALNPNWGVPSPPGTPQPGETITVPVQRVYIVENSVLAIRADTLESIPLFTLSLGIDVDSWTWGFTASAPAVALSQLQPNAFDEPVVLRVSVNGTIYGLVLEKIARERAFGQATLRLSGRGISALLDKPYAAQQTWANTEVRTAQQLVNDALTVNGVPIGWAVDWAIDDWLVPTGAFNVYGSHMDAVVNIVQAAGAFVLPDPLDATLRIRSLYPVAPWGWAGVTPDIILPSSVTTQESIEWVEKPAYDGVYVSGQAQGILAHVKRTGTAGEALAPMVTHPLMTATEANRQRGRVVLSDTGKQAKVTLRLPVLDATGPIEPGKFVRFDDGALQRKGYTRALRIEVNGETNMWQSIEVETHA